MAFLKQSLRFLSSLYISKGVGLSYPSSENNHRGSHKIVFSFFLKYIRRRYLILPIFFSSMHNRLEFDCRSNVTLFFLKVDGIIELNW